MTEMDNKQKRSQRPMVADPARRGALFNSWWMMGVSALCVVGAVYGLATNTHRGTAVALLALTVFGFAIGGARLRRLRR